MNSEERHQLHDNDLAGALDRGLRKVEPYSNQILIGILAATVLAVGFMIWQRSSGGASAEAWGKFAKAETADDFLTVADDFPGTDVANWARLRAAEQYLNQGLQTATSDRKSTTDNLTNAVEAFEALLSTSGLAPQVRERSLYGLAVARETLSSGDTTKAIEAYETLRSEFPQSPYANIATQRAEDLKKESTREFYAWFDAQPRKPEDRPKPKDLGAGPESGSTADPFVLGTGPESSRPANPDRPPSPELPAKEGPAAQPFPGDAPSSPAPETSGAPATSPAAPAAPASATPPAPATPATNDAQTDPPAKP